MLLSATFAIAAASSQPGTSPSPAEMTPADTVALVVSGIAVIALILTRSYRLRAVSGPLRLQPGRPAWPLALVLTAALVAWFGSSSAYVVYVMARAGGARGAFDLSELTGYDYAALATLPPLLGFLILLVGDRFAGRFTAAWLGLGRRRLVIGIGHGALAAIIIIPGVMWAAKVLEWVYDAMQYAHPDEHELLRVMREDHDSAVRWLIVLGAVVGAPFFEEYLFRGHLQTLLRQALLWLSDQRSGRVGFPVIEPAAGLELPAFPPSYSPPGIAADLPAMRSPLPPFDLSAGSSLPLAYAVPGGSPPPPPPSTAPMESVLPASPAVWQGWAAIAITSLAFAMVHEGWTRPLIFLLSLALGYTYERTGSLWTVITVHALFNGVQTLLFFAQLPS